LVVCLCGKPGSFFMSLGQADWTCERSHNDQVIIFKCTGVSRGVKQRILY